MNLSLRRIVIALVDCSCYPRVSMQAVEMTHMLKSVKFTLGKTYLRKVSLNKPIEIIQAL